MREYFGSYTGPIYNEYGHRRGFVSNADITAVTRDAWLEHLTIRIGYGTDYVTRVAENPPPPLVLEAMGHHHEVTAVSVVRGKIFGPRGGYEVGDITGDQVTARIHTPGVDDCYRVYRRMDGGSGWRAITPEMSPGEYERWNGLPDTIHRSAERIPELVAWLDTVPAPPVYLCLLPVGHPHRRSPGM